MQLLESDVLSEEAVARFRALLVSEGVDFATMRTPGAQAPMRWLRDAYPAIDVDQASFLGYFAGEQVRLTSYSLLSLPLVGASSVSEVLRLLEFIPLISNAISARFFERSDAVLIMLTANSGDLVLDRIPVFYCAAAIVHLLRILSGDPLDLTIHVACPQPPSLAGHPECAAGKLRFNAPMHYIIVPRSTLEAVCRFSDPLAYQNAIANLQTMMIGLGTPDEIAVRVKHLIDDGPGLLRIDEVAKHLNLSVSTLKRRLAESGTNFSEIMERTLRDRAMLMLMDASMTLEAIGWALGYSDLANFSHAFKRWTGVAPGIFRRRSTGQWH